MSRPRHLAPRDLLLLAQALRLAWRARAILGPEPLPAIATRLTRLRWLPRGADPAAAARATYRACARLERWAGTPNTCLVRALVLGALLADRGDVLLHLGFAEPAAGAGELRGHAWLTVGGALVEASAEDRQPGGWLEIHHLALSRGRG